MTNVKNKSLFILGIFLTVFIAACNKGGKTGLLIPNDAGLAIHVDLATLSSKLSWAEIRQTSWFTEAFNKSKDSLAKQLLNDPEISGIDPKGSLVLFLKRTASNGYVAIEGSLKDAAKFSRMIGETKDHIKVARDGDLNFAEIGDDEKSVIYFNDRLFVFIADASDLQGKVPGRYGNAFGRTEKYSLDSLKTFARNTFRLKGDQLLDSDKRFESLISDKADMHYWVNSGTLYGGMLSGVLSMMKFSTILDGNIGAGKVNFDNGKITMEGRNYYGKEMTDFIKKYSGKTISNETISHLPDGDVLGAFALNFPTQGLLDFIKLLGVDGFANAGLAKLGINPSDISKAVKGEYAFALSDITVSSTPAAITLDSGENISYDKDKTKFDFVFGTAVGDQAGFQKLIDVFNKEVKSQLPKTDSSNSEVKQKLDNKWFVVSNTQPGIDAFLAGNKKPAYAQSFNGHTFGGYINLQKIFRTVIANSKDTSYKKGLELSAAFWKNVTLYSDLKDGEASSKVAINLSDANTNALKQLNRYIDQVYQATPKKSYTEDFPMMEDTTVTPPAPPTVVPSN
ncbi:DUF4836 domain-containing protein [Niabella ginsenosidivorans]|uniref:DUF4836 domain-containing protein n=1 Tax=Niabella ginsenosidivorans TaxID=1176587 RepID=A0A1A9HW27_9BACT|nr:DUF4836 family protein [Niabella ginsenosidivorans]ANH79608.1 DUF4836 domain-containing protein [Niabella ginsenosidivorans]